MTAPSSESPADLGARRAAEYLRRVEDGRSAEADALLDELADARELVFVGAAFTTIARRTGRTLPTAMRAQAGTRQVLLGQLRDRNRRDVEGLRGWLREAAAEVRTVQRLAEVVRERLGGPSAG